MTQWTMPLSYLGTVCEYVSHYGGGSDFSLIPLLDHISKMFGSQLFLGEEFLAALTFADFKDGECTYPFIRASLWACQLHSQKHSDSISRLLAKSDVERLKTAALKPQIKSAEQLLKISWDLLDKLGWLSDKKGVSIMARFMIRVALFLCRKSGKGREKQAYESLTEIHEAFSAELDAAKKGQNVAAAPAASSSTAGSPAKRMKLVSLEAREILNPLKALRL